ncbi:MAG TPA: 3-hydroxyacyl-CoA dehydrogenase family protein [Nocardioides sp.]|nr:3-hydroxyacyl-CoA dehydrogenase family protein [Nocardioides sp.]
MTAAGLADRPIAVIGAGTLGRRIALMFATGGGTVRVCDLDAGQRADAAAYVEEQLPDVLGSIPGSSAASVELTDDLATAVADAWLVVESLPERLEIKVSIFGQLDQLAPEDAILATNSSSYPSSEVIDEVTRPERVVNLHFFMPPGSRACELMTCGHTSEEVFATLQSTLPRYGLTPFRARKESRGFIYNRIWAAIKREALMVVAEGVATPQEVDALYALVTSQKEGPFRKMDRVGLDVVLDIEENYAAHRDGLPESPRELVRSYLEQGRLGEKSGHGFFDYEEPA